MELLTPLEPPVPPQVNSQTRDSGYGSSWPYGVSPRNFLGPLISTHHLLVPVIVPTMVTERGIFEVIPV